MATKKAMWVLLSVFIITAWLLGSVAQVMAETGKGKFINRVTKMESVPIPDAEGHSVGMTVIEGAVISEISGNVESAWQKVVLIFDWIRGVGSFSQYATTTYQDGSTITSFVKGQGGSSSQAFEIIHGTGRFKGIKGTGTSTLNFFPPEKGEIGWRTVGEYTMTFTLPPK